MFRAIIMVLALSSMVLSCTDRIEFECYQYSSPQGVFEDTCSGQWKTNSSFIEEERRLFDFPFSFDLQPIRTSTNVAFKLYGNPIEDGSSFRIDSDSTTAIKMVIVDEYKTRVAQYAFIVTPGQTSFQIDKQILKAYIPYRVYYGFYGLGGAVYAQGYGNILRR